MDEDEEEDSDGEDIEEEDFSVDIGEECSDITEDSEEEKS
jgi:hypothetical protein